MDPILYLTSIVEAVSVFKEDHRGTAVLRLWTAQQGVPILRGLYLREQHAAFRKLIEFILLQSYAIFSHPALENGWVTFPQHFAKNRKRVPVVVGNHDLTSDLPFDDLLEEPNTGVGNRVNQVFHAT